LSKGFKGLWQLATTLLFLHTPSLIVEKQKL